MKFKLSNRWLTAFALSVCLIATDGFAQVQTVTAPVLPPGKSLVITYRALISEGIGGTSVSSTAEVSGDNFSAITPAVAFASVDPFALLQGPVHFLWNGALAMQNVVSILNTGATPLGVDARMLNPDGTELSALAFAVPANGEIDLPVNALGGFSVSGFGSLRLEFSSDEFAGNGFLYRFGPDRSTLEYMVGATFQPAILGNSYVTFNTIQPSRRKGQLQNEVANWLSVSNMDKATAKSFAVNFYSQTGQLIRTEGLAVPPLGRRDLSAGHENPGPGLVGLIEIVPADTEAPYAAQVTRYGASGPISSLSNRARLRPS